MKLIVKRENVPECATFFLHGYQQYQELQLYTGIRNFNFRTGISSMMHFTTKVRIAYTLNTRRVHIETSIESWFEY